MLKKEIFICSQGRDNMLPINKVEKSKFCKGYDYDIPSIAGGYLIE
jgi:hypothetical protein